MLTTAKPLPAEEVAAIKGQLDRLLSLPAVAEQLGAEDAQKGAERARLLDVIEAAEIERGARAAAFAEDLRAARVEAERAAGAYRSALAALAEIGAAADQAARAAERRIGEAERALLTLGGDAIESLCFDLGVEHRSAQQLRDVREVRAPNAFGIDRLVRVESTTPALDAHAARLGALLAEAHSLRRARLSPREIAGRVAALRAEALIGAASYFRRAGVMPASAAVLEAERGQR